jgi:hypothetical protein
MLAQRSGRFKARQRFFFDRQALESDYWLQQPPKHHRRRVMEGRFSQMAALVDQLRRFCEGHQRADLGVAAREMLADLRSAWPEVSDLSLEMDPDDHRDAEEVALGIVRDVGEVAGVFVTARDPGRRLAWAKANLIHDLERYVAVADGTH